MIEKLSDYVFEFNCIAADAEWFDEPFEAADALAAAEALLSVLEKQHAEFLSLRADEYLVDQLENSMLGYSRH